MRFHMRFDSRAAWEGYRTHRAHIAVINDHFGAVLADRSFIQDEDAGAGVRTSTA